MAISHMGAGMGAPDAEVNIWNPSHTREMRKSLRGSTHLFIWGVSAILQSPNSQRILLWQYLWDWFPCPTPCDWVSHAACLSNTHTF